MKSFLFVLYLTFCALCFHVQAVQGQNTLPQVQDFWLQTSNSAAPDTYHFERKQLTVSTTPFLHYGCGYASRYHLNWLTDSTFTLSFKVQLSKCDNGSGIKKHRSRNRNFAFETDHFHHWILRQSGNGDYELIGSEANASFTTRSSVKIILEAASKEK